VTIVIFGGGGDLTHRKLLPALYNLHVDGLLPPVAIVGVGRNDMTDEAYRAFAKDFTAAKYDPAAWAGQVLASEPERAALLKLWPIGKFPVLNDDVRGRVDFERTELDGVRRIRPPRADTPQDGRHAQHQFLRREGCDMMQGYRFCRPMDAAALEMWIAGREQAPPSNVVPMIAA